VDAVVANHRQMVSKVLKAPKMKKAKVLKTITRAQKAELIVVAVAAVQLAKVLHLEKSLMKMA
jgi:hypothetical protein